MTRRVHRPDRDSLARQADVPAEALRFYERARLLPAIAFDSTAGDQDAPQLVQRLRFIHSARDLGFSLAEIRELLGISDSLRAGRDLSYSSIASQVGIIDAKLVALMRVRQALMRLQERFAGHDPRQLCPILAALQDEPDD